MVAYALRWSPGDEVLIGRGEFPMDYANVETDGRARRYQAVYSDTTSTGHYRG